eukprot:Nk52_evm6s2604 gene=Nk52_evmTU6s2604
MNCWRPIYLVRIEKDLSKDVCGSVFVSEFRIDRLDEINIGRDPNTTGLVLDCPFVSRQHATISKMPSGEYQIEDHSMNGTYLNNIKIKKAVLKLGDTITFGGGYGEQYGSTNVNEDTISFRVCSESALPKASKAAVVQKECLTACTKSENVKGPKRKRIEEREEPPCDVPEGVDAFINELSCTICQELQVNPHTLTCSHSFCHKCIVEWLFRKKECPICRTPVEGEPRKSIVLQNLSTRAGASLTGEDKENWEAKVEEDKTAQRKSQMLEKMLNKIQNKRFARIKSKTPWTEKELKSFEKGLKMFTGPCRAKYVALVGLTPDVVRNSSGNSLRRMLTNIGRAPNANDNSAALREQLIDVLRG